MLDLSTLNPPQLEAVQTIDGPLLVLAGAGSGKTRVIVHRIAWMLEKGISPQSILAVTFTNKAAAEMRERVAGLVGTDAARQLTVSTFHAFGCEVLRRWIDRLGYPRRFAIADAGDQTAIVKRLLQESAIDEKSIDVRKLLARISRLKCEGKLPEVPENRLRMPETSQARPSLNVRLRFSQPLRARGVPSATGTSGSDIGRLLSRSVDAETVLAERILSRYQRALRAQGMVDFDDLIQLPIRLLAEHGEIRERLQERFRYLLVDEYQDTNRAQLRLLKALSGPRANVCAVGDDDQSIYSWRGAEVDNILSFDRHFPGVKEIRLEQNYRSTGTILDAANAVIARNTERKAKRLWTASGRGEPVHLAELPDERAEASFIAREIRRRIDGGMPPRDIAVLYRTNLQSRAVEEAVRELDIPYEVIGGQSFFDRKEIKDLLAYLKLLSNPADDVSLLRVINTPPRGIGEATVEALADYARTEKLTLSLALSFADRIEALSETAKARLEAFRSLIARYRISSEDGRALGQTVKELVEETGLKAAALSSVRSVRAGQNKVRAIEAFIESAGAYASRGGPNPPTLQGLISKFSLDGIDDDAGLSGTAVHLMTLHAAKGLEWPCVFICGLEEDLLPHPGMEGEPQNLPEERRLAYVGITRAKETLFLTRAKRRAHQGKTTEKKPSRYLADIPQELCAVADVSDIGSAPAAAPGGSFWGGLAGRLREMQERQKPHGNAGI